MTLLRYSSIPMIEECALKTTLKTLHCFVYNFLIKSKDELTLLLQSVKTKAIAILQIRNFIRHLSTRVM
jgi:hypothetical protein